MRIPFIQRIEQAAASGRKLRSSSSSSTANNSHSNGDKHHEEEVGEEEAVVAETPRSSSPDGKNGVTLEERVETLEIDFQVLESKNKDLKKLYRELQMEVESLRRRDEEKEEEQDESSDDGEYAVEKILRKRTRNRKTEYQIKWEGYNEMTWESMENLTGCQKLVEEFEKHLKSGKEDDAAKRKATSAAPKINKKKKRMSKRY